jgi:hypothetical protein
MTEEGWKRLKVEVERLESQDELWETCEIWEEVDRIRQIAEKLGYIEFPSDYLIEEISEKAKQIIEQAKGVICPTMSVIGTPLYVVFIPKEAVKRKAERNLSDADGTDYEEWLELTTGTVVLNVWKFYTDIGGALTFTADEVEELDESSEDGCALGEEYDIDQGSELIAEEESLTGPPWVN